MIQIFKLKLIEISDEIREKKPNKYPFVVSSFKILHIFKEYKLFSVL